MLPTLKQIRPKELGEDVPVWLDKLAIIINSFFQNVYALLNGRLKFVENIQAEIVTLELRAPVAGTRFKTKIQQVEGILLLGIKGIGKSAVFTTPPVIRARQDGMEIVIDDLSGLTSAQLYSVKVLVV
jgi:hypothetical protein